MMELPLRNLKVKRARNNFLADTLRWNYASGSTFFGIDKRLTFLLGGLFILDFKKRDFPEGHEVFTVRDKGWLGQKNGALLKLMIR